MGVAIDDNGQSLGLGAFAEVLIVYLILLLLAGW